MTLETQLRARMTAYAEAVAPGAPDLEAARATAGRRDRARTRTVAGAAATLLAVAVGGGLALRSGGAPAARITPSHDVTRAAPLHASPLPGLVELDHARLPAGLVLVNATAADGQVWAVATDATTLVPSVLHGVSGSTLAVVRAFPGADVQVVLRQGRAIVVTTISTTVSATPQKPQLITYDAASGRLQTTKRLGLLDGAAIVPATTPGGPLLLAESLREGDTQYVGISTFDGMSLGLLHPVAVPPYAAELAGHVPDLGRITAVTTVAGVPRYAYLTGDARSVLRLDLDALTHRTVQVLPPDTDSAGQEAAARIGFGGRLLYDTKAGLLADTDGHLPLPPRIATGDLTIVAGRVFEGEPTSSADLERQLDPTTLAPTGPAVFNTAGGTVSTDGALYVTEDAGALTFYGAP